MPKVSRREPRGPSISYLLTQALEGSPYGIYWKIHDFGWTPHIKVRILGLPWGKSVATFSVEKNVIYIEIKDERAFEALEAAAERIEEKHQVTIEISLPPAG